MKKAVFLSCVLMTLPVFGQTVHKCPGPDGKILYQQSPCGGGVNGETKIQTGSQQKIIIDTEKPSSVRLATPEETDQCLQLLKTRYSYKDPDSVKIEGDVNISEYPSGKRMVFLKVNAKNSYGAYAGAKLCTCTYTKNGEVVDIFMSSL